MNLTIEIMYSCKGCGIVKRKLRVMARESNQGIKNWLDYLKQRLSLDHSILSPTCLSNTLSEVWMPIESGSLLSLLCCRQNLGIELAARLARPIHVEPNLRLGFKWTVRGILDNYSINLSLE